MIALAEKIMSTNKYGLNRQISAPIKREIRQRCGFGCVNCGNAIYQYEHVDPLFSEAKKHDPECIVLLCGGCHDRVTRGILSKETIKEKSKKPKCLEQGFSFGPFDLGMVEPEIIFGTLITKGVKILIRVLGDNIFSVNPPEQDGLPFLINAKLTDNKGNVVLEIVDNEWITTTNNWDVEIVGTNITIRRGHRDIVLSLRSEAPGKLVIERLLMFHRGVKIIANENKNIEVITKSGQHLKATATKISNSQIGIDINNTGISVGVGGGSISIEHLSFCSTQQGQRNYFQLRKIVAAIRQVLYR